MILGLWPARKRRFQLGAYQRIKKELRQSELEKKLKNDEEIKKIRLALHQQEAELQQLTKELHKTQAQISKRKGKVKYDIESKIRENLMADLVQKPSLSWPIISLSYIWPQKRC